ncbi:MAG TPA: ABC transporter ATP-binding protein [Armatimonadetes bacterium]|jgi:putative ABC transport system ATP-binding protein|nr:ABC transporter ATP-binding protein [Armatimonadota bacterium]
METHIQLKRVTRLFQKPGEMIRALDGVDLEIPRGSWSVIVGVSGSGKSTLLSLLGGLDRATEGEVLVDGRDLSLLSPDELAEYRRTQVGFVFQSFSLIPTFTALENVLLPFIPYRVDRREAEQKAWGMLEKVGMASRASHLPGEMSGGEQQRVALARALVNDPVLLLADEPTGELDTATGEKVMGLLRNLHEERGVTIVMTSHDPRIAEQAPRLIRLEDGRVTACVTQ